MFHPCLACVTCAPHARSPVHQHHLFRYFLRLRAVRLTTYQYIFSGVISLIPNYPQKAKAQKPRGKIPGGGAEPEQEQGGRQQQTGAERTRTGDEQGEHDRRHDTKRLDRQIQERSLLKRSETKKRTPNQAGITRRTRRLARPGTFRACLRSSLRRRRTASRARPSSSNNNGYDVFRRENRDFHGRRRRGWRRTTAACPTKAGGHIQDLREGWECRLPRVADLHDRRHVRPGSNLGASGVVVAAADRRS